MLPPPPLMLQRSILAPETGQRPGEHAHEVHPTLHPLHQTQRDQETAGLGGEQVTGSPQSPGNRTLGMKMWPGPAFLQKPQPWAGPSELFRPSRARGACGDTLPSLGASLGPLVPCCPTLSLPAPQGEAPGRVPGVEGEHPGASGRVRLPPPLPQVPATVSGRWDGAGRSHSPAVTHSTLSGGNSSL